MRNGIKYWLENKQKFKDEVDKIDFPWKRTALQLFLIVNYGRLLSKFQLIEKEKGAIFESINLFDEFSVVSNLVVMPFMCWLVSYMNLRVPL